jgi:hypothetical protein
MRIVLSDFMRLDGVVQAPGGPPPGRAAPVTRSPTG